MFIKTKNIEIGDLSSYTYNFINLLSIRSNNAKENENIKYVQSHALECNHLHVFNELSGTIDSKREWRIHTYNNNIWVFNPVYNTV